MLTGAIVGLAIGLIGAVAMMMRRNKQLTTIIVELASRGIPKQAGGAALGVPPTRLTAGGAKPVVWSAVIPGTPAVFLYNVASMVVVAWQSRIARAGSFLLGGPYTHNPDKALLQQVPKREVGVKGVAVYTSSPEITQWVLGASMPHAFQLRFGKAPQWNFVYADGVCYVFTYQATWKGIDDMIATAGQLESTLS